MAKTSRAPFEVEFEGLLSSVADVVSGFRASGAAFGPDVHLKLSEIAVGLRSFKALAREMRRTFGRPPYTKLHRLEVHDCEWALRVFLLRSGCYRNLWDSRAVPGCDLAAQFAQALRQPTCAVRQLVPLDGLCIRGTEPLDLADGVRLVQLGRSAWEAFFEASAFHAPSNWQSLDRVWALERQDTAETRRLGILPISFESDRTRVSKVVGFWLPLLNLYRRAAVRPLGLYERPESPLAPYPFREWKLASRTMLEDEESESPWCSLQVEDGPDLQTFLRDLEASRKAMGSGRVDNAIRVFGRISEALSFDESYGSFISLDLSSCEDATIDGFSVLEGLFLKRKEGPGKSEPLSRRLSALLAPDDAAEDVLKQRIVAAYKLRNDIVHCDEAPHQSDLRKVVQDLSLWLRQALVATLRLAGDRDLWERACNDPALKAKNRLAVPHARFEQRFGRIVSD